MAASARTGVDVTGTANVIASGGAAKRKTCSARRLRLSRTQWMFHSVLAFVILGVVSGDVARSAEAETEPCVLGTRCEAEYASLHETRAETAGLSGWSAFSGSSFVLGLEYPGTSITWRLLGVPGDGNHPIDIRFSNNRGQDNKLEIRTLTLVVNRNRRTISFPVTQSWRAWSDIVVGGVALNRGGNTVALTCGTNDTGRVNIDFIEIY
jgi:hypothetical protein